MIKLSSLVESPRRIGYEEVYNEGEISMYLVTSYEGISKIGRGTTWCVGINPEDWKYDSWGNNFYVIVDRRFPDRTKFHKIAIQSYKDKLVGYYSNNSTFDDKDVEKYLEEVGIDKNLLKKGSLTYKEATEGDVNEASIKRTPEERLQILQKWLDDKIAKAPGNNRIEKTTWLWANDPNYGKVVNNLTALQKSNYQTPHPDTLKANRTADRYYIRFGPIPKEGRSYNFLRGYFERGVSAYPAKWNTEYNKWEIISDSLSDQGMTSMYELFYQVGQQKRPVFLIQGQEMDDEGDDGEPLLFKDRIAIIKQLEPHEFFEKNQGEDWYVDESMDCDEEIQLLEEEWDKWDAQGIGQSKQAEIMEKIDRLRALNKKAKLLIENINITIDDINDRISHLQSYEYDLASTLETLETLYYGENPEEKQMVVNYINLLNKVGNKVLEFGRRLRIPYIDERLIKLFLIESKGDERQLDFFPLVAKEEDFFPFVIYVSSGPDDRATVGIKIDINGKPIEIFEGNDEATEETVRLVNKLVNPQGRKERIFASHDGELVDQIKATGIMPVNLFVSPNRNHAYSHMDLEGERKFFTGIIDINSIDQVSHLDWKTIEPTKIEHMRILG